MLTQTLKTLPESLKPFTFHGLDFKWDGGKEAIAQCPFCDRLKFSVDVKTGVWCCNRCRVGSEKGGGNATTFIRQLWKHSVPATSDTLCEDRGLLFPATLAAWNVVRSPINGSWLVPGYLTNGEIGQLYKFSTVSGKRRLLATPSLSHQMCGIHLFDPECTTVMLCEGVWDAMALWEVANNGNVALDDVSILSVPGCNVFQNGWAQFIGNRTVVLLYDNDYPREEGKESVALQGIRQAAKALGPYTKNVHYVRWGKETYHDSGLGDGYDVRDALGSSSLRKRCWCLSRLLERVVPVEPDWLPDVKTVQGGMACKECTSYSVLQNAWRKAMRWTHGLEHALTVMLASIASTKSLGDQLWIKVIGPAACGKSTLCEALSVNREYVLAKSTIRGFHSGFTMGKGDAQDHSLLAQLPYKTLVTKDGDTLLQSPNLPQILSEARDIYDGTSRTHFRNAVSREYEGVRMTWILCGTSSLRSIDSSELGERFLDCVIMEKIDDDLEDEILWRVANRAERNVSLEANGKPETQYDPQLAEAMQLTGGYVDFLRETAVDKLPLITMDDSMKRRCAKLGKFVAYMRARPSTRQDEIAERELASRLVSQHIRLAKCLALVLNKTMIDEEVMQRVTRVALDTGRGQTLAIASHLYTAASGGLDARTLALLMGVTEPAIRKLMRFLHGIGAIDMLKKNGKCFYVLSHRMHHLYKDVIESYKIPQ